jgi:hypothetical protein
MRTGRTRPVHFNSGGKSGKSARSAAGFSETHPGNPKNRRILPEPTTISGKSES